MMHVKDMKELVHFKGDGGNPAQWIGLFPYITSVGDGVLDLKSILAQARESGVKHFFVEQDMAANPTMDLQRSVKFLEKL
jgi:sugar phosphate isomerase/epimerase